MILPDDLPQLDLGENSSIVQDFVEPYKVSGKLERKQITSMAGFTKLFHSITTSSIWNEDDKTRIVWVTMLALCDLDGIVRASVGGLAHTARVSKEDCQKALDVLISSDGDSRSEEFEGRRIEKVNGGFLILNYLKYRECRDEEDRKEYMREYMREYRKQRKHPVSHSKQSKLQLAKEEVEEEKEVRSETPPSVREVQNPSKPALKNNKGTAPADPRHKAFVDQWVKLYAAHFGQPYVMNGGRDGKQLSDFLKTAPHLSVERMCEVAQKGWAEQETNPFCKACKASVTICGYVTRWNEISAELGRASTKALVTHESAKKTALDAPENWRTRISAITGKTYDDWMEWSDVPSHERSLLPSP